MVKIAHASLSENRTVNGTRGDQTGKEVCIRGYYVKPWTAVLRFKDPQMRERVAVAMEKAANNDFWGYSQNDRNSGLIEARKVGYDPEKVAKPVNTDCSALVTLACIYAGIPEGVLVIDGNSATTSTLRPRLKATGTVDIFTTGEYTRDSDRLVRGDILLAEGSHVAVVVSSDLIADNPFIEPHIVLKKGMTGDGVKWLQWELNRLGYVLEIDGDFGELTENAVKKFQTRYFVDCKVGSQTRGALKTSK